MPLPFLRHGFSLGILTAVDLVPTLVPVCAVDWSCFKAGVTKATVSIVFDNTNKDQSPVGYADHDEITVTRQVVLGGKNKYLINGHNAQKGRVENFFHSVQLNVNNPHFLIMQGRITKVLNMKPPEILSMIEEAAGTRMYETKKAGSLQVMEKKEQKMNEIERMLAEEIQPTLEKLRKERAAFFEWQKNGMEIEHLNRLVVAHQYMQAEEFLTKAKTEMASLQEEEESLSAALEQGSRDSKNFQQNINIIEKKRNAELSGGLKDMEDHANELSKGVVKATEKWKSKKADREAEEGNKQSAIKSVSEAETSIKTKEADIEKSDGAFDALVEKHKACEAKLAEEERRYNAVSMGMSDEDGAEAKTFVEQIKDAKTELSALATEVEQAKMRIEHQTPALKEKRAAARGSEKEHAKASKALEAIEKDLEKIDSKMQSLEYDEAKEAQLEKQRGQVEQQAAELRDVADRLGAKLANLEFSYKNPEPGFDRSKVKGLVAELIDVKREDAAVALEVTAGGKLYNVVVDDEVTAKKLLSKGQLKRRVTIIPLNKIQPRSIDPKKTKLAEQEVGAGNVDVALSLVGYDAEVKTAMQYVFGGNFVCPDMNTAKKVTFNEKIRTKSVTLDGDVMDPSGTLTGGARKSSAPILAMLHQYKKAKTDLASAETDLARIDSELGSLRKSQAMYNKIKSERELKVHQIELARSRIEQSSCHHVLEEIKELEASLETSQVTLRDAQAREKVVTKKISSIEKEMAKAKAEEQNKLKLVEKAIVAAKKAITKAHADMVRSKQTAEENVLELAALKTELVSLQKQVIAFDETITTLQEEEDALMEALNVAKQTFDQTNFDVCARRCKVEECENEIHELTAKVKLDLICG